MSLKLIGVATILYIRILDLPNKASYEHAIGVSNGGNQVYVPADVLTVRSHIVCLPAIHDS